VIRPEPTGIDVGRLAGREAHLMWVNLDIGNMSLDEVINENEPRFLSFDLLDQEEEKGYAFRSSTKRAAEE
jgi:hypothetical protein